MKSHPIPHGRDHHCRALAFPGSSLTKKISLLQELKKPIAVVNHPLLGGGEVDDSCIKTTWGGLIIDKNQKQND
jgi:hypothetical protein